MKGVILVAGNGTRLRPITNSYGKALVPLYNKPMIFYGLSLLFSVGIDKIALVCSERDYPLFTELFKNKIYKDKIEFFIQKEALGTAHAVKIAKDFIGKDDFVLLFGDNIFVYNNMTSLLKRSITDNKSITLFAKQVSDPERFGVVEFDKTNKVLSIEEKPEKPKSNYAATGLYVCKNNLLADIDNLKMSSRGEYEFTDVIAKQVKNGVAKVCPLPKECAYLDTGTFDSLLECSFLIKEFENKYGLFGAVELELYKAGLIDKIQLEEAISIYAKDYKTRLQKSL